MFSTEIIGISELILSEWISTSGSTIMAFAPFSMAKGTKSIPFWVKPLMATKRPPSFIFLESEWIFVISKSKSPNGIFNFDRRNKFA